MTEKSTHLDSLLFSVCKAIQQRRDLLGISQEEVAQRAGLHRTYISDLERAARNPTLKTLSRVAVALEISTSDLIRQAEQMVQSGVRREGQGGTASPELATTID